MSKLKWNQIEQGSTFESLVAAIVVRQVPGARPFGKPGPDGGIDIVAGDGRTVFQAKLRRTWSASSLVSVAQEELEKISRYRASTHANLALWKNVDAWVMVTNGRRGKGEEKRWRVEVEPAFAALGIRATWWAQHTLEAWLLDKYPGLRRAFFGGETRCFLTQAEARQFSGADNWDLPLIGREVELARFEDFLAGDRTLLQVSGPGGVGKTRLLWEFGQRALATGRDVWWAEVQELGTNPNWYAHLVPEREAVILVDEPNSHLLERMVRQAETRAAWRIVAVTRGMTAQPDISVDALDRESAEALAWRELGKYASRRAVQQIAQAATRFPQWIVTAARLVTQERLDLPNLPRDAAGIADSSLRAMIDGIQPDPMPLLHWIALMQPVNADVEPGFLSTELGIDESALRDRLEALVDAQVLVRRGRLHAIKPDVLRDYILHSWLVNATRRQHGSRSRAADALVGRLLTSAKTNPPLAPVLAALARVELQARLQSPSIEVQLLAQVEEELLRLGRDRKVSARLVVLGLAEQIQASRPDFVIALVRQMRTHPADEEASHDWAGQPKTVSQVDVLDDLPWALFGASGYVQDAATRTALINEMAALIRAGHGLTDRPQTLWFGGKSPKELLSRLITGEDWFLGRYEDEAAAVAHRLFDALFESGELDEPDFATLETLIHPLVDATTHFSGWEPPDKYIYGRRLEPVDSPKWPRRAALLERLWTAVSSPNLREPNRLKCWSMLHEAHRGANEAAGEAQERAHPEAVGPTADALNAEVHANLKRILELLGGRMSPKAMLAARGVWHWHALYDEKNPAHQALAIACQRHTWASPRLALYESIIERDRLADLDETLATLAKTLARLPSDEIVAWVEGAVDLLGSESESWQILGPLYRLGESWTTSQVPKAAYALAVHTDPRVSRLATRLALHRCAQLRQAEDGEALLALINQLLDTFLDDTGRRTCLANLYSVGDDPLPAEFAIVEHALNTVWAPAAVRVEAFFRLGCFWWVDPNRFVSLANRAYQGLPAEHRGTAIRGVFRDSSFRTQDSPAPEPVTSWLLQRLASLPELDDLSTPSGRRQSGHWHGWFKRMVQPVSGTLPWSWLADLLTQREQLAGSDVHDAKRSGLLPRSFNFARLLRPYTTEDAPSAQRIADFMATAGDATVVLWGRHHLAHLDPKGLTFIPLIVAAIEGGIPPDGVQQACRWSMLLSGWPEGSDAWRPGAIAACRWAQQNLVSARKMARIWSNLYDGSSGVLMGREAFLNMHRAKAESLWKRRDAEGDPHLRQYWAYRARCEEGGYDAERERLDEETLEP